MQLLLVHTVRSTRTHTFVSVMSVKRYKATMYDAILEKKRAMHVPIQWLVLCSRGHDMRIRIHDRIHLHDSFKMNQNRTRMFGAAWQRIISDSATFSHLEPFQTFEAACHSNPSQMAWRRGQTQIYLGWSPCIHTYSFSNPFPWKCQLFPAGKQMTHDRCCLSGWSTLSGSPSSRIWKASRRPDSTVTAMRQWNALNTVCRKVRGYTKIQWLQTSLSPSNWT